MDGVYHEGEGIVGAQSFPSSPTLAFVVSLVLSRSTPDGRVLVGAEKRRGASTLEGYGVEVDPGRIGPHG